MLIATVSAQTKIPRLFSTQYPFVWGIELVYNTAGTYWQTIFGAPSESQLTSVQVLGLTINDVIYLETDTLTDAIATPGSWFFDNATQQFWVHLVHDVDGFTARAAYGRALGFADDEITNINDIEFLPAIESVPSLSQVQDLVSYDKLATINGEMVLRNVGGLLDYLRDENLIGGDVNLFYLDDDSIDAFGNASSSDLIPLAAFYVEDFKPGYEEFRLQLQDKRLQQDAPFPATRFAVADYPNLDDSSIDLPIPVVYGYQRELKAYPTNGKASSTTVRYRAGLLLTALTTVYLKISDKWTVSTPSNIDLTTGEFDVAGAKSGTTAEPYACKVEATGIAVTYASDVIKDLNLRYGGVGFTDSFYDTAEWTAEETSLLPIGVVFKEITTIFEAARQVQAGANIGFRYEISATGKRTIRIDNNSRMLADYGVDNVELLSPEKLIPEETTEFLAAQIRIGYQRSDESDRYLTVLDATHSADVLARYRTKKEVEFDTLLTTLDHATTRASLDAARFSVPITTVEAIARGSRFLQRRILDTIVVALTADGIDLDTSDLEEPTTGRAFFGVQKCKIVGIDPDFRRVQNKLTLQIIEPITPTRVALLVYADGVTRIASASGPIIRSGGQ